MARFVLPFKYVLFCGKTREMEDFRVLLRLGSRLELWLLLHQSYCHREGLSVGQCETLRVRTLDLHFIKTVAFVIQILFYLLKAIVGSFSFTSKFKYFPELQQAGYKLFSHIIRYS